MQGAFSWNDIGRPHRQDEPEEEDGEIGGLRLFRPPGERRPKFRGAAVQSASFCARVRRFRDASRRRAALLSGRGSW